MPKVRPDQLDHPRPYKEKVHRRKQESFEEFRRDSRKKGNKRVKKIRS